MGGICPADCPSRTSAGAALTLERTFPRRQVDSGPIMAAAAALPLTGARAGPCLMYAARAPGPLPCSSGLVRLSLAVPGARARCARRTQAQAAAAAAFKFSGCAARPVLSTVEVASQLPPSLARAWHGSNVERCYPRLGVALFGKQCGFCAKICGASDGTPA